MTKLLANFEIIDLEVNDQAIDELIGNLFGEPPILLLDDVLAELDKSRQLLLLEAVGETHQCLISATHLEAFEGDWQRQSQVIEAEFFRNL